jgi:hypothetical protein
MKILDMTLNAMTALGMTVFVAYFAVRKDEGLFTVLPDGPAEFFTRHGILQYVALGIAVLALIAKVPVVWELKRRRTMIRQ